MALHDWTRVPDNVFHAFHLGWLWNLAGALDRGLLPSGYVARPEDTSAPTRPTCSPCATTRR